MSAMDSHGISLSLQGQVPQGSLQILSPPTPFALKLLERFSITNDRDALSSNNDFLNGTLVLTMGDNPTEDEKIQYYVHCLKALDWSFSERVMRSSEMALFFASAIEDMEEHIREIVNNLGSLDPEAARAKLFLDNTPFRCARRLLSSSIQELPKDEEVRVACQALFLFLLRPFIPLKYETLDDFLDKYLEVKERSSTEQNRLRHTANWMDLAFYTIQPRNNKTFILNLIPRIVEGRAARYITGSGQTKPTADRVNLFRLEGNCEKIKRPPRRKKDEMNAFPSTDKGSAGSTGIGKHGSKGTSPTPRIPAPMPMMAGLPGAVPHPSMMAYPAMYMSSGSGWMHYQPLVPNCPPPGYPMPHLPSPFPSKAFSSSSHGDKGTSSSWVTPETASMNAAGSIVDSFKMPGVSQPLPPSFIPSSYWPAGSIPTANPAHIPPGAMAMHPGQVMGAGGGGIGANEDGIQVGAFYPSYYPRILVQPLLPPTSTMISQPSSSPASAMSSTSMSTSLATTFPCTVLGKRAVEGEQQQESEPDNRACGLNLLFAAVNSLEANFS